MVNVDISPVVIEQMQIQGKQGNSSNQRWEVADCRCMPQFADNGFGCVVDKGTLDAVLCSSTGQRDVARYVGEVHRILAPGGTFLLISLGRPVARLGILRCHGFTALPAAVAVASGDKWKWASVTVMLLPKPSIYLQNEATITGRTYHQQGRRETDKDMPIQWLGPYAVGKELDEAVAEQGLDLQEFFFAFVCVKAGGFEAGSLPGVDKGVTPNGGSAEPGTPQEAEGSHKDE